MPAQHRSRSTSARASIAPNKTPTVKEAGDLWIEACKAGEFEPATIAAYEQHLRFRIVLYLGTYRLAQLTVLVIRQFRDEPAHW